MCAAGETTPDFSRDALPVLKNFCHKCHGLEKTKGGVNFVKVTSASDVLKDPKMWQTALRAVRDKEMPPEGKLQPSDAERATLLRWMEATLNSVDVAALTKDPGRVTAHRLNRVEYNNTIRDLLGVDTHPADSFPADGSGGGGFDNNADTLFVPPILLEKLLRTAEEILDKAPDAMLFAADAKSKPLNLAARESIEHFASRAYRRPATSAEIDGLLKLAQFKGGDLKEQLKRAYKAVLCSPHFLFRVEIDPPGGQPHPLGDYEMASRLSYFLWASMPDDELLAAAAAKSLQTPETISKQVARMLKDPKARAFCDSFCAQWLDLADFKNTAQPDPRKFPEFTPALRDAMLQETMAFFDNALRGDGSLLDLLDSNYTFLNEDLARHYGIKEVSGKNIRRVSLTDKTRGGLVGMGSVLVRNSYPLRTSPVLRGKWVLSEMLGAPPPPPPADVKVLSTDDKSKDGLPFRKRLELHRSKPECAGCHARMDPIGFGLENFDPMGRWRTEVSGQKVDATGVLTSGEKFDGPAELKAALMKKKDEVIRNLAGRMLSYALGRGLESFDAWTVKQISEAVKKEGYKGPVLVREIALSYPFRNRKGADANAPTK